MLMDDNDGDTAVLIWDIGPQEARFPGVAGRWG